ncbi:hypothetical protein [Mycobacterium simiae]|uniref:hypothetical protein n=1 Tax=Mycobacterium simiae TaxID=1784 RepID=UPI0012DE65E6|nr:hypothetical protein [Mycobacterium simiae]
MALQGTRSVCGNPAMGQVDSKVVLVTGTRGMGTSQAQALVAEDAARIDRRRSR